ncbi:MAG TPA: multicopper oxidase domain-containing protein [Candidatus Methylomirabilis sp.]|nr:multicopper oxidase domain-containing protein [Candidatus Methylomirabilis sp.]
MPLHIIKADRLNHERTVHRYMQEMREIARGGFSRRELLKMGLVMGGAGLIELAGMPTFRPYWAHADDGIPFTSPPNTPFTDPLPILPVMKPVTLNPAPTKGPNPVHAARVPSPPNVVDVTGFPETDRPFHQRWEEFLPKEMYESVEQAVLHNFYPARDKVPPSSVWTFVERYTGAVGPLRIKARYGAPIVHRIHNALPEDNGGFGKNTTSTHLHNGHTASESDGGPLHGYEAGRFKDFHYANVRAGFSKTHPTSTLNGRTIRGDYRETMSFLWFHDHEHDFTAQNTYKGLVSVYTLFSDDILLDTDDETTGLRLPSGEFDISMLFGDKVFDPRTGQLFFDLFNLDGILGDKETVNGKIQPFLEVKRRKYRFRLLDGGPSRVREFFLSNGAPFIQLTNDGNLLPRPLTRKSIRLQVAERVDVIVDFSKANPGEKIYLQNRLEQLNGRSPTGKLIAPTNLVEFRVEGDARDDSVVPATLLELPSTNVAIAQRRSWKFDRSGGAWSVNGQFFNEQISARIKQNTAEQWTFESAGGWVHPAHPHMEEFQILSRDGNPPPVFEVSRKDMVGVGDAVLGDRNSSKAKIFMQFRDWQDDYPMHCHNTVHEDHGMMILFDVVP